MDRKLIDYLPPVLHDIVEFKEITEVQQSEIKKAWDALEFVLNNQFIDTASAEGIAVWEKELGILSSSAEPFYVRKERIKSRWLNQEAYTLKTLISRLNILCGEDNFTVDTHFDKYLIESNTHLDKLGQVSELKNLFDDVIPCNIVVVSKNTIECKPNNYLGISGVVICTDLAEIRQGDD